MKKVFIVGILLMFVLACSPLAAPTSAAIPPTAVPPTVAPSPTPGPQQYFTEGFDQDVKYWSTFYLPPEVTVSKTPIDKVSVEIKDGFLQFDIGGTYIGAFSTYDPYDYNDVRLDARVENRGNNTNDLALMCRYSGEGWYEVNIESSGLYFINYIEISPGGRIHIHELFNGGSNSIKQDANEYGMVCLGDSISLYINGAKTKVVNDNNLRSGKVALQGFSLNRVPVILYFDWVKISQP